MKPWTLAAIASLSLCNLAFSQATPTPATQPATQPIGDIRTFDLTPTPPPSPALKYQLLFDPADRHPGNAALLYSQAELLFSADLSKLVSDTDDASFEKDQTQFNLLAEKCQAPGIISLLDLAARCEQYDRGTPWREKGFNALIPSLNETRALANLLKINAIRQIRAGKITDGLQNIRIGMELGRKVASEPILVSGLVGNGILAMMTTEVMDELLNRPDSPNLYWAFVSLPRPLISEQNCWQSTRLNLVTTIHELSEVNIDRISADQWHVIIDKAIEVSRIGSGNSNDPRFAQIRQILADEITRSLPEARLSYAATYNLPANSVELLDPFKVVATYWFNEYQAIDDDYYKLTALPYVQQAPLMQATRDKLNRMIRAEPANVFLTFQGNYARICTTLARADRSLAALTIVEALRTYAASHGGALPATLSDIPSDIPIPTNPATARPFGYTLQGDTATLSDLTGADSPLTYTIRIRK